MKKTSSSISAILKIAVAVLLLLCLTDLPYSFYQIIRFAATAAFAWMSYDYFKANRNGLGFVFVALTLLFQPFFKIALGRMLWNAVDVLVIIGLVGLLVNAFGGKKDK